MAILREQGSGGEHLLVSHTLIGRAPHCQLRLDSESVSTEHAAIRWSDSGWVLRDLGSTNGTWLNDQQVLPGRDVAVNLDDRISFADVGCVVCNAEAPAPSAVLAGSCRVCAIKDGVITIPDETSALASIFRAADGGWTLEVADEVRAIRSGEAFRVGDEMWTFSSPTAWQPTARRPHVRLVGESTLIFDVSSDEERVALTVEARQHRISMGQLSGYYFLLTLARLKDHGMRNAPAEDGGWVHRDDVGRLLRCGEQQLNVWIHRVRSKFELKGFLDYANIVERRDGTGQMRLGAQKSIIHSAER